MNKGKPAAKKGTGFGEALFSIKDVQMDYANFDNGPPLAQPMAPPVAVPKKNPIAPKMQPKPVVPVKPTTANKPKTLQQK